MSKQEELVKQLSELTVLELAELKKALEAAWGVEASAAAVAVAAPVAAVAAVEESTEFNVVLEELPAAKKIAIIKIVREVTGLGLKEAKEMVEGVPAVIKEGVSKTEAEDLKKKFEEAEAKVSLKGL